MFRCVDVLPIANSVSVMWLMESTRDLRVQMHMRVERGGAEGWGAGGDMGEE